MIERDFHVHTTYCDGKNTPEEMVKKALSLNFKEIGLVCHSYTFFDESYCIPKGDIEKFIAEINGLKQKYGKDVKIYCGVEYDYFSDMKVDGFDFVIGSLHYVYKNGEYLPVDESKERVKDIVRRYYGGDFYRFCEEYYRFLGEIYAKITPNFIAHFDLVSKYNGLGDLFDEKDERYVKAWKSCADKLLSKNAVFEINVGAIVRGYKNMPYPSKEQMEYIKAGGGTFLINSDCHSASKLGFDCASFIPEGIL